MASSWTRRVPMACVAVAVVALGRLTLGPDIGQAKGQASRSYSVTAKRYGFSPARIEISQGDIVTIELRTEDIAHSLTIDAYRVSKRVNPGQPVSFEFRADQAGTFPFYCNLQIDDGCRQMKGELVVRSR